MKPILLCDQDGPLADFDHRFFGMCADRRYEMDIAGQAEQRHRFATEHIIDPLHRAAARHWVNTDPLWFSDLPPVDGAVEGINLLAEHFEVFICTKPLEVNRYCRDGKAAWVRKHLGKDWEQRLIITPDKSVVNGAILLDDAPKPAWFERASWLPVIFPTSFNGAGSEWEGIFHWGWGDPIDMLLRVAEQPF